MIVLYSASTGRILALKTTVGFFIFHFFFKHITWLIRSRVATDTSSPLSLNTRQLELERAKAGAREPGLNARTALHKSKAQ